jgi:hypothetical protein
MPREVANSSFAGVKTIHLDDIDFLVQKLLEHIDQSTFVPDQILYLETGARLLAASMHRKRRIPTFPIGRKHDEGSLLIPSSADSTFNPRSFQEAGETTFIVRPEHSAHRGCTGR